MKGFGRSPLNLPASLVEESLRGFPSDNDLAASIESNDGADPSRQAVALRLNERRSLSSHGDATRNMPKCYRQDGRFSLKIARDR